MCVGGGLSSENKFINISAVSVSNGLTIIEFYAKSLRPPAALGVVSTYSLIIIVDCSLLKFAICGVNTWNRYRIGLPFSRINEGILSMHTHIHTHTHIHIEKKWAHGDCKRESLLLYEVCSYLSSSSANWLNVCRCFSHIWFQKQNTSINFCSIKNPTRLSLLVPS